MSRDNNLITMKIMHSLSNANSACHSTRNTRHVADSATFCRSQLCYRERLSYRRCACLSHARNLSKLMNLGSCGFTDGQPRDFSFLDQLSYPRSQGRTLTLTLTVEMPLEKTRRKHASVALRAIVLNAYRQMTSVAMTHEGELLMTADQMLSASC